MIQIADKTRLSYLTPKEKSALEHYYHTGEQNLMQSCKEVGYPQVNIHKVLDRLKTKKAALDYLQYLRDTQTPENNILTECDLIAFNRELRPEVRLDALSLLDKLKAKNKESLVIDEKTAIPTTIKDRVNWLTEQLKGYKSKGQAGLSLAEEISKSIYSTTSGVSHDKAKA